MAYFNYCPNGTVSKALDCRFVFVATLGKFPQTLACISRYTPHFAHLLFNLLLKGHVERPLIVSSFFPTGTVL